MKTLKFTQFKYLLQQKNPKLLFCDWSNVMTFQLNSQKDYWIDFYKNIYDGSDFRVIPNPNYKP